MKHAKIKHWKITGHKHLPESIYNELKNNRRYLKLVDGHDKIIIKMIYVTALVDIPKFNIEKGKEYLAEEIYDSVAPRSRQLVIFNSNISLINITPLFETDDINKYFRLYSDGIVPMKVKRKIRTHK